MGFRVEVSGVSDSNVLTEQCASLRWTTRKRGNTQSKTQHATGLDILFAFLQAGEVSRGEKMLYFGTDPESYITEYTFVYEGKYLGF